MIDLMRLQTFILAAEQLSFSEAAKLQHLTQPTVSHHIKLLEKELGVELFDRSGNSLKLTEAGRLMLPWAQKLVHQALELHDLMHSLEDKIVGQLRIACSTTAGKYVLPQLAARFSLRYPGIQVSILACQPERIMLRLLEDEADLGVVSSDHHCGNGLECQEFFDDAMVLIVPRQHPWANRPSIEPAELLEEQMIIREETSGTRRVMLTELAKHDITPEDLHLFLELGNAEAIVRTVQAGFGVSFVSKMAADWALALGVVTAVAVTGLELNRKIYMVRRTLSANSRAQEVFWNFVHHPDNADLLNLGTSPQMS
jgi:DNA-binding transcriptional LysR family regulator